MLPFLYLEYRTIIIYRKDYFSLWNMADLTSYIGLVVIGEKPSCLPRRRDPSSEPQPV